MHHWQNGTESNSRGGGVVAVLESTSAFTKTARLRIPKGLGGEGTRRTDSAGGTSGVFGGYRFTAIGKFRGEHSAGSTSSWRPQNAPPPLRACCIHYEMPVDPLKIANSEKQISCLTKSTADKMYYVQILAFNKHIEKAISILNSIVESEGDYSLSVFICPKSFWEFNFLDDNLCKELSKSSADYVVFPTNLYARYLLVNAYNSLGQMEQCERNKTEFRILRQRYSSVEAYAPMTNCMSNMFEWFFYFARFEIGFLS